MRQRLRRRTLADLCPPLTPNDLDAGYIACQDFLILVEALSFSLDPPETTSHQELCDRLRDLAARCGEDGLLALERGEARAGLLVSFAFGVAFATGAYGKRLEILERVAPSVAVANPAPGPYRRAGVRAPGAAVWLGRRLRGLAESLWSQPGVESFCCLVFGTLADKGKELQEPPFLDRYVRQWFRCSRTGQAAPPFTVPVATGDAGAFERHLKEAIPREAGKVDPRALALCCVPLVEGWRAGGLEDDIHREFWGAAAATLRAAGGDGANQSGRDVAVRRALVEGRLGMTSAEAMPPERQNRGRSGNDEAVPPHAVRGVARRTEAGATPSGAGDRARLAHPAESAAGRIGVGCDDSVTSAYAGRLEIQADTHTVVLDGERIPVGDPRAFAIYKFLFEASGQLVPTAALQRLPGCKGRIDRILRDHLHPALRATIKSKAGTGSGYWISLPQRQVRETEAVLE